MEYTKAEFSAKLLQFFDRHDPSKKPVVPEIVRKFHGHEEEVLDHLANRYTAKEGKHTKKTSATKGPSVPSSANAGDTPSGE